MIILINKDLLITLKILYIMVYTRLLQSVNVYTRTKSSLY